MTSRSEYRLLLRQDNADLRLSEYGRRVGLLTDGAWERFRARREAIEKEIARAGKTVIPPSDVTNALLAAHGSTPIISGATLAELVRRPELSYEILTPLDPHRPELPRSVFFTVEVEIKYEGYLRRQQSEVERQAKLEEMRLPEDLDYALVKGLRLEAAQKLSQMRPLSLGQASRISGVNPADISVLLVYLGRK
jgi:tRNA uridine 5-carboxymethylaminomethyl modification enzyme